MIRETKDYSIFKTYSDNRPVNKGQVKKIKDSIMAVGYIGSNPITVCCVSNRSTRIND